jgi:hypothetical protein
MKNITKMIKNIHPNILPLLVIALFTNIGTILLINHIDKRGGDIGSSWGQIPGDLLTFGAIWLIGLIAIIVVSNRTDESESKYYNLYRAIAIIFCTPIPFITGCVLYT